MVGLEGFRAAALPVVFGAMLGMNTGCKEASVEDTPNEAVADVVENVTDNSASILTEQRACMSRALNNTIYQQQTDAELESALFSQDLDGCPNDFIEGYVRLRNAAKEYLAIGRTLFSHQGRKSDADKADGPVFLCSLIKGSMCQDWPSDVWNSKNSTLNTQVTDAKATMDRLTGELEILIARYGLYARTPALPEATNEFQAENAL